MEHVFLNHSPNAVASWIESFPAAKVLPRGEFASIKPKNDLICWLRISHKDGILAQQLAHEVRIHLRSAKVVAISDIPSDEEASVLLALGIDGYCNSYAALSVLHQVANVVSRGGIWVGRSIMRRLIETIDNRRDTPQARKRAAKSGVEALLTERETSVVKLVARGASNKEISSKLKISERTVKAHLSSAFEKTGTRDRLQLSLKINGILDTIK